MAGQNIGYNVSKTATGLSGSVSAFGQNFTGSYDKTQGLSVSGGGLSGSVSPNGMISGSGFGQSLSIDARSFGTQLNPKDVVDQILWKAKAGGLVPA